MPTLPAYPACRLAVRRQLAVLDPSPPVLVACSGGADSTVLAAATIEECARDGRVCVVVTVDHGLQPGSAERARDVAGWALDRGASDAWTLPIRVAGGSGPEAAARTARYAALDAAAERAAAATVLLGHTRDDQAETVLLALARGSGTRTLAGMPAARPPYRRPFLDLDRALVRAAAGQAGLPVWDDPHNADPRFARARVRHDALPALVAALGPRVVAGLVRSAQLARDDADALDALAGQVHAALAGSDGSLDRVRLAGHPAAVRRRVLRDAALDAGVPPGRLTGAHLRAMDDLVTGPAGRGPVGLPGGRRAWRACDRLYLAPPDPAPPAESAAQHRGGAG